MDAEELDRKRERELVQWLDATANSRCARCATPLCAHERLFASALGHKRAPVCSTCAARELGDGVGALRSHLRAHFARRACYSAAWAEAERREPACALARVAPFETLARGAEATLEPPHETWDAGDLGCGELVLDLRVKLRSMRAGEVLELLARDPGAGADLPAWCRMTGHALVSAAPPRFLIRRRTD